MKSWNCTLSSAAMILLLVMPAPAEEPALPIDRLVETEREFARTCGVKGIRQAFTEFFADDGVNFQPHPVRTKKAFAERPVSPNESKRKLEWAPEFADISAEGDIGYTTGPSRFTDSSKEKPFVQHGAFFSIWKRQPDGVYRVLLDAGVDVPGPVATLDPPLTKGPAHKVPFSEFLGRDEREKRDLARLDLSSGNALASEKETACQRLYAQDARFLRDGHMPAAGQSAVCEAVLSQRAVKKWEVISAGISGSGDLGFTYGRFEREACEPGYFVRVYRRRVGRPWQIAAEVNLPRPPQTPGETSGQPPAASVANWGLLVHSGAGNFASSTLTGETAAARLAGMKAALEAGYRVLACGGSATDAVQAAVEVMEDSPHFNAGKGAVFTRAGTHELDAAIMDGKTLAAGAVAGLKTVKNPIRLARYVMEKSPHVMMIGEGAEALGKGDGAIEFVPSGYFDTQEARDALERAQKKEVAPAPASPPRSFSESPDEKYGTVGAVALDKEGRLAAATSTGGMTNKRPGRVGDVPVIGAGTYASPGCAVSATGHGEYFIRYTAAHDICARVTYAKASIGDASRAVVMDVLKNAGGDGGVIAMDGNGAIAVEFNTTGMGHGYIGPDGKAWVKLTREDSATGR